MKALKYESERSRQTILCRLAGCATLLLSAPALLLKAKPANEKSID